MRVSACLIVKNEAAVIDRCLESLRAAVDEIVVVDTGSTDDTKMRALKAGARVIETPWQDDFAKARNAGLEAAGGDWILVVDADEWFASVEDARALRDSLPDQAAGGRIRLVNHLEGGRTHEVGLLRVIPRHAAIRFEGRIHEQVTGALSRLGWPIVEVGGILQHDGYLKASLEAHDKLARNRRLLETTLKERPDDLEAWFHLGKTLHLQGHLEEAEKSFEHATRLAFSSGPSVDHLANRAWVFRAELASRVRGHEAGRAVLEAHGPRACWPPRIALCGARQALETRNLQEAADLLAPIVDMPDEGFDDPWDARNLRDEAAGLLARVLETAGDPERAWLVLDHHRHGAGSARTEQWLQLASLALQTGRRDQALQAYDHVLAAWPDHISSHLAVGTLLIELGRAREALERLAIAHERVGPHAELDLLTGLARRLV